MKDHLQIKHDQFTPSLDIANGNNPSKSKAEEDESKQTKIAKRYNRKYNITYKQCKMCQNSPRTIHKSYKIVPKSYPKSATIN